MHFFLFNILLCIVTCCYSYKRKKLTLDGSICAFTITMITYSASTFLFYLIFLFYVTSSFATKLGSKEKKKLLASHKYEKTRNYLQVLSNSLFPTILCLLYHFQNCISYKDLVSISYGYYVCCNSDTWSSEIGVLSRGKTFFILNFKEVPKGVNGGISLLGIIASGLGGCCLSLLGIFYFQNFNPYIFAIFSFFLGILGSGIDSILGALFQLSIYSLEDQQIIEKINNLENKDSYLIYGRNYISNNQVNVISAILTSLCSLFFWRLLF